MLRNSVRSSFWRNLRRRRARRLGLVRGARGRYGRLMTEAEIAGIASWITKAGLERREGNASGRGLLQARRWEACHSRVRSQSSIYLHPTYDGASVSLGAREARNRSWSKKGKLADRGLSDSSCRREWRPADMPKIPSLDLRTRVLAAISSGLSCRQAAIRFWGERLKPDPLADDGTSAGRRDAEDSWGRPALDAHGLSCERHSRAGR